MSYNAWSVIFGEQPSAAKWNILGANDAAFADGTGILDAGWTAFTPTWTTNGGAPSIGNGTLEGYYRKIGRTVNMIVRFVAGSTTNFGTGTSYFSLPVASSGNYASTAFPIGQVSFNDASPGTNVLGFVIWDTTTRIGLSMLQTAGTFANFSYMTENNPWTWTTSDSVFLSATYESAT